MHACGTRATDVEEDSEEEFINEYTRPVTVTVSDGHTFKTVIGNQPMTAGGRYFYEIKVNSGTLIKIGVCRSQVDTEQVGISPRLPTEFSFCR